MGTSRYLFSTSSRKNADSQQLGPNLDQPKSRKSWQARPLPCAAFLHYQTGPGHQANIFRPRHRNFGPVFGPGFGLGCPCLEDSNGTHSVGHRLTATVDRVRLQKYKSPVRIALTHY
jgi:hypothetical protein